MPLRFNFLQSCRYSSFVVGIVKRRLTRASKSKTVGVDLSYEIINENGTSKKPPIVILHGLFGAGQNWRTVSRNLAEKTNRKIILTDARNHGSSPHSPDINYNCMVEDTVRLFDKLGLSSVCLMGHSMGGKTAMLTALQYPQRVYELVIVDVAPKHSQSGGDIKIYLDAMCNLDLTQVKKKELADLYLREDIKNKAVRNFLLSNLVYSKKTKSYNWRINLEAIQNNFHRILDFPQVKIKYEEPTAFIAGLESNHILEQDYKQIPNLFPKLYVERIPCAGHWVHADKPKEFVTAVQNFLKRHFASPALQYADDEPE